jgi:hypothetical protein
VSTFIHLAHFVYTTVTKVLYITSVGQLRSDPVPSKTDLGRMGEFLASYILETHGVEVHHVDRAGADLWCRANGKLFTVQVKAASEPKRARTTTSVKYYGYMTNTTVADVFTFVALDKQLLLMRPSACVTTKAIRIHPREFTMENQQSSILSTLFTT